jgi:hypothetical protein
VVPPFLALDPLSAHRYIVRAESPVQLASFTVRLSAGHPSAQVSRRKGRQRDVILIPAEGLAQECQENFSITEPAGLAAEMKFDS